MADRKTDADSRSYWVRDAAKMVAVLIAVGGWIADHNITRSDIARADERIRENAARIKEVADTVYLHRLEDREDSARGKENARRIEGLERSSRRRGD